MSLFPKKRMELNQRQEALARRLADQLCFYQHKVANYLHKRTAGFDRKRWLWLLTIGSLMMGGYCAYLILALFN